MPKVDSPAASRIASLVSGAAEWSDPRSPVRESARRALQGSQWPPQVVEAALGNVLRDADRVLEPIDFPPSGLSVLTILPGNVLGPAVAAAYCAAAAGAAIMLKSSSRELCLADVVAAQFDSLGSPIAGTLTAMRWSGGDADFEAKIFPKADRIVVFGDDETVRDVERRAPKGITVIGYGGAYSLGFVPRESDAAVAARAAALDVALFDQRGCLSPQTIYVEGDEARAIVFAHALGSELVQVGRLLPRALAGDSEKAAIGEFIRRLLVRALPPKTHALDTVIVGPTGGGVPEFVVGVEPFSAPACAGFGRIAIVKACDNAAQAACAAAALQKRLDTIGIAPPATPSARRALAKAGALRICALGEMQRPPLGYRPKIADFCSEHLA